MTEQRTRMKAALTGLQWTLGLVILIEAILFVMPGAAHDFAKTHMPDIVRQVLGWGEIVGAVLLLIPDVYKRQGERELASRGKSKALPTQCPVRTLRQRCHC